MKELFLPSFPEEVVARLRLFTIFLTWALVSLFFDRDSQRPLSLVPLSESEGEPPLGLRLLYLPGKVRSSLFFFSRERSKGNCFPSIPPRRTIGRHHLPLLFRSPFCIADVVDPSSSHKRAAEILDDMVLFFRDRR